MFKKSINYWSFAGGDGTKPVLDAVREAKRAGFEGFELTLEAKGDCSLASSEKKGRALAKAIRAEGMDVASVATGLFWGFPLTSDSKRTREKAIQIGKKLIQTARWAGTDAVLVVPGAVGVPFIPNFKPVQYDVVYKRAKTAIKRLLPLAEKLKVHIGIENVWNMFLLSPLEMKAFIDSFGSRYVGCYFDTGNVIQTGYPEQWIRILGRRIRRVHIKYFKRSVGTLDGFCPILKGDVNFPEVIKALKQVNYRGKYLTNEMVPMPLKSQVKALDKIIGK